MEELKSNQVVIAPEDMEQITNLNLAYQNTLKHIGSLRYEFKKAEVNLLSILESTLQSQQKVLKKYGLGQVNLSNGVFTPTEDEAPIPKVEVKMPKLKKAKTPKVKEVK